MKHHTSRPNRQYAAIPNAALRDERLSIEARGMLALLMSYSDNWRFRAAHLCKVAAVGRDKLTRIMRELTEAGYIKRQPVRTSDGTLQGSEWVIVDDPDRSTEKASPGDTEALKTRDPENPTVGKPAPIRKQTDQENQSLCADEAAEPHPRFNEFFAAYPRPKNRDRSQAEFSKAVKEGADPSRIIAAAKAYAAENRGNARQYLAYSDNWLRDRRWEDQREARPGHKAQLRQTIERMLRSPVPAVRDHGKTLARAHGVAPAPGPELEAAA